MEKLFAWIRANTPPDSVLLADLYTVFYLNKRPEPLVRGFVPDTGSYYAPPGSLVTPDELRAAVLRAQRTMLVMWP